jgi:molybdopterin synthase catalytic subunit
MGSEFRILANSIDPADTLSAVRADSCGALATFVGTVRNLNDGQAVVRLEYEVLESMAIRQFEKMAARLRAHHGIDKIAIDHRRGAVEVGGVSVAIAVGAPHRKAALAACAEAIESLKRDVPIWKNEIYADGTHVWREGS